jgi:isopentenyl-diphosphate delta-isomerase
MRTLQQPPVTATSHQNRQGTPLIDSDIVLKPASTRVGAAEDSACGRADDSVVLVNAQGQPTGESTRAAVHTTDTALHLAFSLHVFDADGQVLLTRRALGKATWAGVWTNSCCGHPRVGEALPHAVRRRASYELGLEVAELTCVLPDFAYTATDASGIVENEICPVFFARLSHPTPVLSPNPDEVMDWKWVAWDALAASARLTPFIFSPWAVEQLELLTSLERSG